MTRPDATVIRAVPLTAGVGLVVIGLAGKFEVGAGDVVIATLELGLVLIFACVGGLPVACVGRQIGPVRV